MAPFQGFGHAVGFYERQLRLIDEKIRKLRAERLQCVILLEHNRRRLEASKNGDVVELHDEEEDVV